MKRLTTGLALGASWALLVGAMANPSTPPRIVPLAELLRQPETWRDRPLLTQGSLRASQTGQGCTKMACAFPPTAQVGDRLPCNRCVAPAEVVDAGGALAAVGIRCGGQEVLTYRGPGRVDRAIAFTEARFGNQRLRLGQPYRFQATLRLQPAGHGAAPSTEAAWALVIQAVQ